MSRPRSDLTPPGSAARRRPSSSQSSQSSSASSQSTTPAKARVQKNLFSFFSPRPPGAASSAPPPARKPAAPLVRQLPAGMRPGKPSTVSASFCASAAASASKAASKRAAAAPPSPAAKRPRRQAEKEIPTPASSPSDPPAKGCRIEVFWPDDSTFYVGEVTMQQGHKIRIDYEDGEFEVLNIKNEAWRYCEDDGPGDATEGDGGAEEEEQEEEMPDVEESDEEDGSVFKAESSDEEMDDEEVEFDEDEDEEEDLPLPRRRDGGRAGSSPPKPTAGLDRFRLEVIEVPAPANPYAKPIPAPANPYAKSIPAPARPPAPVFVPARTPPKTSVRAMPRPTVAPARSPMRSGGSSVITPPTVSRHAGNRAPPPLPEEKVVNPMGSHWHNHYSFLWNPRDASGTPADGSDGGRPYDPRTLRVDLAEIQKVTGSKVSPAQRQWWDIKSRYFDSVLLFKVGKFYELFNTDADVGVKDLAFVFMKGQNAHSGFPEQAYGTMTAKLIAAGYKVARVEQTETPAQLKKRKARTSGKKPEVVNREVCSVQSVGTRTFCYLDDRKIFDEKKETARDDGAGPLLSIREVALPPEAPAATGDVDHAPAPVCEFGVAAVDSVRSVVTLGEFADDVLRSRMHTLLCTFRPAEILLEGGPGGASKDLLSMIRSTCPTARVEYVNTEETIPRSTAVELSDRKGIERPSPAHPWDADETVSEIGRKRYFGRGSKEGNGGMGRWPEVLRACVEGGAKGALSALGAALFYLQRGLVDEEIMTMSIVKPYVPPESAAMSTPSERGQDQDGSGGGGASVLAELSHNASAVETGVGPEITDETAAPEVESDHMAIDGITLENLEILSNKMDTGEKGTLWGKLNCAKSPHGCRILRAWLLRPLFRKADIDRRADAVTELVSGAGALAMSEVRPLLARCGDIERLLSRIHSMSLPDGSHPNGRAVLYEMVTYNKRKVEDFSRLLNGLKNASRIAHAFEELEVSSGLLRKIVTRSDSSGGGCFPDMEEELDWFFDNFDCKKAKEGEFEPPPGMDQEYDDACNRIEEVIRELECYKSEMCKRLQTSQWNYVNTKHVQKDKYLIELPVSVRVPSNFLVKGKKGKGAKQVNKYYTKEVVELVGELEQAIEQKKEGKERGLQIIFHKFDSYRPLWAAAAQATAMLDALGALAEVSSLPGFCRAEILECAPGSMPKIEVTQGRHFCVDSTYNGGDFIPNDLSLGDEGGARLLLLSGPNMGGKSTLLRQTCLIAVLAQLGCHVPAEACTLTPFDRIFTRLGASDRILQGQSTFFVELSETAAALRGATARSLVIMDELGRGTSTFDGTALAHAVVKHLVDRSGCIAMFATHYHSLLDDWRGHRDVRLGHMECICSDDSDDTGIGGGAAPNDHDITFLYTLGEGACPRSFGINVARLAGLPVRVLEMARQKSMAFEAMCGGKPS